MSVVTMPTSVGRSQSHGNDENKGRRRLVGKGRDRSSQLENPRATHPGKSVSAVGTTPLATPRKPLSDRKNFRLPAATPSQKLRGFQSTSKKSDRKHIPGGSAVKTRQTSSQQVKGKRDKKTEESISSAVDDELETFPDIETMTRRQEPDEFVSASREFVPPAYFNSLAAALKRPLLPPLSHTSSVLSSITLEPETELRPTTITKVTPVECDRPYREELNLSVDLPDIDIW